MKNFTLIELLVVVAIIAILASLLMPSLSKAKKSAERAVCASNESQIGVMVSTYAKRNDGKYPWASKGRLSYDDIIQDKLTDALKNEHPITSVQYKSNVFECPSSEVTINNPTANKRTYVLNGAGANMGNWQGIATETFYGSKSCFMSEIESASKMILIAPRDNGESMLGFKRSAAVMRLRHVTTTGHRNKYNFLYSDGHVALKDKNATLEEWRRDGGVMWQ